MLDWSVDGDDWPNRSMSRFVQTRDVDWHVQIGGQGDAMLLLHGTGASTHSWRDLLQRLSGRLTVVAPDLPGHGFSRARRESTMSLPGMAQAVADLLGELRIRPMAVVGHSAGAAIAARMMLDGLIAPARFIAINPALLPLGGAASPVLALAAGLLTRADWVARLFSHLASDPGAVRRLVDSTGSRLDERGLALYRRVIATPAHVSGTLAMMANWDLRSLVDRLPGLAVPTFFILGANDRTIPAVRGRRVARQLRVPPDHLRVLPGCGHLVHEERPDEVASLLMAWALGEAGQTTGTAGQDGDIRHVDKQPLTAP